MLQSACFPWTKSAIATALLLSLSLAPRSFAGDAGTDRGDLRPPAPIRQPLPTYKIQAGIDGEIYPVFANYASLQRQGDRTFGVVSVTLSNTSQEQMSRRISVKIPGWSDEEIQTVEVAPGTTRTVFLRLRFCLACIKTMRSLPPRPRSPLPIRLPTARMKPLFP